MLLNKNIVTEMIARKLDEANSPSTLSPAELQQIARRAKQMAQETRRRGGSLAGQDADYLEQLSLDASNNNIKGVRRSLSGGETDNREDAFAVIANVIGKQRARIFATTK